MPDLIRLLFFIFYIHCIGKMKIQFVTTFKRWSLSLCISWYCCGLIVLGQCQGKTTSGPWLRLVRGPCVNHWSSQTAQLHASVVAPLQHKCLTNMNCYIISWRIHYSSPCTLIVWLAYLLSVYPQDCQDAKTKQINNLLWSYVIYLVHVHTC